MTVENRPANPEQQMPSHILSYVKSNLGSVAAKHEGEAPYLIVDREKTNGELGYYIFTLMSSGIIEVRNFVDGDGKSHRI